MQCDVIINCWMLCFRGTGGAEKNVYEVTISFCEDVIPQVSVCVLLCVCFCFFPPSIS